MKRKYFVLREQAADGTEGGAGGAGAAAGSKWSMPEGSAGADPNPNDDDAGGEEGAGGAGAAGGGPAGGGGEPSFTPSPLWNELSGVEGFKMPEGITKENEIALLKQALIDNKLAEAEAGAGGEADKDKGTPAPVIDDPEIAAYMRFKQMNPDATLSDFMGQRSMYSDILSMPDKEFMMEHYKREYGVYDAEKNPDGLTQEEINDLVSSLESNRTLALESKKLKRVYRQQAEKNANVTDDQIKQANEQRRNEAVTKIRADARKLFAETEKITELNGVKLGKAEITQINTAFEEAIIPNDKGEIPIFKMLQSDRVLWNFFAVNYLGDEKFKSALFNAGDSTKEDLMKRLGLKPIAGSGRQADTGKRNAITPGLWTQPDLND